MAYNFSESFNIEQFLPRSSDSVDDDDAAYRRRWNLISASMLILAITFNISVGIGIHLGIAHIEEKIMKTEDHDPEVVYKAEEKRSDDPTGQFQTGRGTRAFTLTHNLEANHKSQNGMLYGWNSTRIPPIKGVQLTSDSVFKITSTAIFQIYSQMTFKDKRKTLRSPTFFKQAVLDLNSSKCLLVDSRLVNCVARNDLPCSYTSVLFSTLPLVKGQQIAVNTSHGTMINRDPDASFFAIYKLV